MALWLSQNKALLASNTKVLGDPLYVNKYNFISKNTQSTTTQNRHESHKSNID